MRAVEQRYRIIYAINQTQVTVLVVALDIRKDGSKQDIYTLANKVVELRASGYVRRRARLEIVRQGNVTRGKNVHSTLSGVEQTLKVVSY